jgi:hypothetical protein
MYLCTNKTDNTTTIMLGTRSLLVWSSRDLSKVIRGRMSDAKDGDFLKDSSGNTHASKGSSKKAARHACAAPGCGKIGTSFKVRTSCKRCRYCCVACHALHLREGYQSNIVIFGVQRVNM